MKGKNLTLRSRPFLLYCFALAAVYLLICSKSSPLYPMNDWVDVNCFYTMGKSLLAGQVPYVDLYEQKGPVLYFVYALVALVTPNSYFGVYLLEVVSYGLFLYFSGLIAGLYLGDKLSVWISVAVLGGLIPITYAFAHGASVEEMGLFLSAYGLYAVLRAIREERTLTFREGLACGIFSGVLLWIKYTMLGLYLGLAVFVALWYLAWGWRWRELLRTIGAFFAGLAAVSAVVVLYFLLAGGLEELFTVYFYNNIFLYPKGLEQPRLLVIWNCLQNTLTLNRPYTLLFLPGMLWALLRARRDVRPLLVLVLTFLGLALGTYWGGWGISYYGLVFAVYTVFGLIAIVKALRWCLKRQILAVFSGADGLVSGLVLLVTAALMLNICLVGCRNVYLLGTPKDAMPQYRFAKQIRQVEDPKLLNYGFLDGGFYYAAQVVPNCRFFCTLNVQAPDMWQTQRNCVRDGEVDFVVTRDKPLTGYMVDSSRYVLADQAQWYFEGKLRTYYLYRLENLSAES